MSELRSLPPSDLLLDQQNPRLQVPSVPQREILREIATAQNRKLVALATDVIEFGLSPADPWIVMPIGDDRRRFVVLEGNRRLAAIRGLESPDTLHGSVDPTVLKQLKQLAERYRERPIDLVPCVVVGSREEADHWIELKHGGQREGAGVIPWGTVERDRFLSRGGRTALHTQALDFLEKEGMLDPSDRKGIPSTSLQRLLGTPEFRKVIGMELENGTLHAIGPRTQTAKALNHVVDELKSKRLTVKEIYTQKDRQKYAENFPKQLIVKPNVTRVTKGDGKPGRSKKSTLVNGSGSKKPKKRMVLIPSDCVLNIKSDRVKSIEEELRRLNIEEYPNAVSVMLRVFVELSVDYYLDHVLKGGAKTPNDGLTVKLKAVLADLVAKLRLTATQAKPVEKATARDSYLLPSVTLLHKFVHNYQMHPSPTDLRASWDNLQAFLVAIWS